MKDRRSSSRMLCSDLVDVSWQEPEGPHKTTGNLEDISEQGLSLQLELPLERDVPVTVEVGPMLLRGIVRYCYYREIGYFVGVELERGTWSPERYRPQHLLDLRHLLQNQRKPTVTILRG